MEDERRRGSDRLAHRVDAEDGVTRHRAILFDVHQAVRFKEHDLAMAGDHDDSPCDLVIADKAADDPPGLLELFRGHSLRFGGRGGKFRGERLPSDKRQSERCDISNAMRRNHGEISEVGTRV